MFQPWAEYVPAEVELLSVQYPGRAERFRDVHREDAREIARAVVNALAQLEDVPTLLLGHSFGGIVAFETAAQLESAGTAVQTLWVSSVAPPGEQPHGTTHQVDDADLWRAAVSLGGIDASVVADDDLAALLLPALRADIKAHETYAVGNDQTPISAPIHAVLGNRDRMVSAGEMAGWERLTGGRFQLTVRAGGHFHLHELPNEFMSLIFGARSDAGVGGSAR